MQPMKCLYSMFVAFTLVSLYLKKNDLEEKLSDWRKKLKQLHSVYDKLLFFYIPKMLRMSKMLHHGSSMFEAIPQLVQEVSFLFDSTKEARQHIKAALNEVCVHMYVCMCMHACVCKVVNACEGGCL